jgi:membrane-bound lytic murein transglycosylase B
MKALATALALAGLTSLACQAAPPKAVDPKQVEAFVQETSRAQGRDAEQLRRLLGRTEFRDDIIKLITRPAEGKPWYKYREIFLTRSRIDGGVAFWQRHRDALQRAEREYGVPAEMIVAILGVETRYGGYLGKHRVIDALYTLGFGYPKRSDYFRRELANYLKLMQQQRMDPLQPIGSYAGAMGMPQFMPSSYLSYAVDFSGDGDIDLWNDVEDIIGSVANYFKRHGWQAGQPVAEQLDGDALPANLLNEGLQPERTLQVGGDLDDATAAGIYAFDMGKSQQHWLGYRNFYVITRYNHSRLYAMAAFQLSQAIASERARRDDILDAN